MGKAGRLSVFARKVPWEDRSDLVDVGYDGAGISEAGGLRDCMRLSSPSVATRPRQMAACLRQLEHSRGEGVWR